MADMDRVLQIMCRAAEAFRRNFDGKCPYIAVVCKHGNACGLGVDFDSPVAAVRKAMLGDPIAVMGGELMTNFAITDEIGNEIYAVPDKLVARVGRLNWGVDVVAAPEFSPAAVELLAKKAKRKLLANMALHNPMMNDKKRMLRVLSTDEFLTQGSPLFVFKLDQVEELVGPVPKTVGLINMIIAWVCAWQADSNTASLASDGQLIGLGCGDQDRIWCCDEAIRKAERAGHKIPGAMFASDGFFPYAKRASESMSKEGLELFVEAGCIGGVVPADGKNLPLVKDYVRASGMVVAFVRPEHRGFMFHA
jgi:phosphoribosylaminoimidazolecarboxamide formyltransferase/IMP cyclohydrolase